MWKNIIKVPSYMYMWVLQWKFLTNQDQIPVYGAFPCEKQTFQTEIFFY